jgi:hypothetical protein
MCGKDEYVEYYNLYRSWSLAGHPCGFFEARKADGAAWPLSISIAAKEKTPGLLLVSPRQSSHG